MILVNNQMVEVQHFPDGTQLLKQNFYLHDASANYITWHYENDGELLTLIYVTKHLKGLHPDMQFVLNLFYVPNARFDRIKDSSEVFTLKYFCDIINSLEFYRVYVLDPHSNVTPALIKNVWVMSPMDFILDAVRRIGLGPDDYVYFPDEGAYKRYSDLFPSKKNVLIGHKVRDWETGKIKGLHITTPEGYEPDDFQCMGHNVIMIDDIISYGGTLAYSADKLKGFGFEHIYAYATHTENSVLDPEKGTLLKRLENGTVDCIYTTNSLYTGQNEKVIVLNV